MWVRVHCEPRTALYVPSEEDLAVEEKWRLRGLSGLPGAQSSDAAGGQAPTLGELGPTRCTSLIYQDGTVDYVEDEEVWANGEELSLSKQWIGQTEFIALPPDPTSEHPSAEDAVDYSALRRVRRGIITRATSEGDAACQGEITSLGPECNQPGGPSGLLGEEECSEPHPLGGRGGSLDQGVRSAEAPEGPSGS